MSRSSWRSLKWDHMSQREREREIRRKERWQKESFLPVLELGAPRSKSKCQPLHYTPCLRDANVCEPYEWLVYSTTEGKKETKSNNFVARAGFEVGHLRFDCKFLHQWTTHHTCQKRLHVNHVNDLDFFLFGHQRREGVCVLSIYGALGWWFRAFHTPNSTCSNSTSNAFSWGRSWLARVAAGIGLWILLVVAQIPSGAPEKTNLNDRAGRRNLQSRQFTILLE